jgi:hypothetical protein
MNVSELDREIHGGTPFKQYFELSLTGDEQRDVGISEANECGLERAAIQ